MSEPTPNYEPTPEPIGLPYGLTPQEFNELKQASLGFSVKQAAKNRWVTEQAIKFHRSNMFRKIGVANSAEAVGKAIADGKMPIEKAKPNGYTNSITPGENQVLVLVAEGLTNSAIGQILGIGKETVKSHVHNLLSKLDAQTRAHAVRRGYEYGLLEIPLNPDQSEASANVVPIGVGRAAVVFAHAEGEYPTPPAT
jgi:DNA-binding CsgD family transcriptional regulator